MKTLARLTLLAFLLSLTACASLSGREPVQVSVVGLEPLAGEGLELRMLLKLRLQNPDDTALAFNGIFVRMDLQGQRFATGVSNTAGEIPRFGESVVNIPMSVSAFNLMQQALGAMNAKTPGKVSYELSGKLSGPLFRSISFSAAGELSDPLRQGAAR